MYNKTTMTEKIYRKKWAVYSCKRLNVTSMPKCIDVVGDNSLNFQDIAIRSIAALL